MSSDQVKQWEKKDPNNIDEMPVKTGIFHRCIVCRCEASFPGLPDQNQQDGNAYDHVKGMHAGHGEVKRKEKLQLAGINLGRGVAEGGAWYQLLLELVPILDSLDTQKDASQHNGEKKRAHGGISVAELSSVVTMPSM